VDSLVFNAVFQSLALANGKAGKVNSSSLSARDRTAFETLTSSKFTDSAYKFCSGTCYIIAINFYDPYDKYINPYFLSVDEGSCTDTFSTRKGAWSTWKSNPAEPLVESYFMCTMSEKDAWVNAVGVTMGNLGAVSLPLVFVVMLVGYLARLRTVEQSKFIYPYDATTRSKVMNEVAVYYLRVRDGTLVGRTEDQDLINRMVASCTTEEVY